MSDSGGDGGSSSKGGDGKGGNDQSSGFTPTGVGVNAPTTAETITAGPSAMPFFSASTDISATDASGATTSPSPPPPQTTPPPQPAAPGDMPVPQPVGTPVGATASPNSAVGASSVAAPASVAGTPTDLTSDVNASLGLNSTGAVSGTGAQAAAGQGTMLSPDQLGQPATGQSGSSGDSGTAAAPAAKKDEGVLSKLGISNPLSAAVGAAGLGYSMLQGKSGSSIQGQAAQMAPGQLQAVQDYLKSAQATAQATGPNATAQTENAKQLYQQGQNLVQYLQTGTLPPDAQASLDQATKSAKAAIVSRYASQGMNTDPTQNSVLNQELQQVDQQAIASKTQLEQQYQQSGAQLIAASQSAAAEAETISNNITSSGTAAAGLSSDLYKTLVGIDQTAQAQIGAAIANFAKAVGGTQGGTTIKLG